MKKGTIVRVKYIQELDTDNRQGAIFAAKYGSIVETEGAHTDVQFPWDGTEADRIAQQARYRSHEFTVLN